MYKLTFSLLSLLIFSVLSCSSNAAMLGFFDENGYRIELTAEGPTSHNTDDFFTLSFVKGSQNAYLKTLVLDIEPADGFFDIAKTLPGKNWSPLLFSNLKGITMSDFESVLTDGSSVLTLNFNDGVFTAGDSLSFGVDMDRISTLPKASSLTADELAAGNPDVYFEVPVPEPSSAILGMLSLVGLSRLKRKK